MISIESNQLTPEEKSKIAKLAIHGQRYRVKGVDTSTGHHVVAYTYQPDPLQQTLKVSNGSVLSKKALPLPSHASAVLSDTEEIHRET